VAGGCHGCQIVSATPGLWEILRYKVVSDTVREETWHGSSQSHRVDRDAVAGVRGSDERSLRLVVGGAVQSR
jgi:hypothetical protein